MCGGGGQSCSNKKTKPRKVRRETSRTQKYFNNIFNTFYNCFASLIVGLDINTVHRVKAGEKGPSKYFLSFFLKLPVHKPCSFFSFLFESIVHSPHTFISLTPKFFLSLYFLFLHKNNKYK